MNQSKFSLADVLTILTALGFGFICFLGTNFYTLGNIPKSILIALIITLLLFSTAFTAKLLKRTSVNFKTRFISEMVLLVVFTMLLLLFTYMPFSHYFTVSAKNTIIVNKIQTSIAQAENMFPKYELEAENRMDLYNSKLKSVIAAKEPNPTEYANYGFKNGISDEIQLNKKMENISATLFPTNYSDSLTQKGIKEVAMNWLLDAKSSTVNWKPIGITNVVVDIESKSNEWLSMLIEISKIKQKNELAEDFTYPQIPTYEIKQYFTTIEKVSNTSLIFAFITWALMMLSWFVTKRHTRFPGFKILFSKSGQSNNEL
jgi:hypothetical protein